MTDADLLKLGLIFSAASAAVMWLAFAEHPTAKNLRRALLATFR